MMYCSRIIPRYFFKNLSASVNVLRNNSFWQNSQLAELLVPLLGRYLHFVFCNISQVSSIQILSFKEVLRKSWLFGWPVHMGLHGCLWEPTGHCRPKLRAMFLNTNCSSFSVWIRLMQSCSSSCHPSVEGCLLWKPHWLILVVALWFDWKFWLVWKSTSRWWPISALTRRGTQWSCSLVQELEG